MYSQMSEMEYSQLLHQNKILERDRWGVKVLETPDNRIIKIFRLKRLLSTAYFIPYALRFKWNANRLKKKGFETVTVDKIVYCREKQRHVVSYQKIPGQPIKYFLEKNKDDKVLINKLIAYIALLHDKGIYFRSLHFGNIIVKPNGEFALIDISDLKFFPFNLTTNLRIRNWKHMLKYDFERSIVETYGWDVFFSEYADLCSLKANQVNRLKSELSQFCNSDS